METMANGVTSLPVGETQFLFGGKNLRKKVSNCFRDIHDISYSIYIYYGSCLEHVAIFQVLV